MTSFLCSVPIVFLCVVRLEQLTNTEHTETTRINFLNVVRDAFVYGTWFAAADEREDKGL